MQASLYLTLALSLILLVLTTFINCISIIRSQNPNIHFDLVDLEYKLARYQPKHIHLAYDDDPRNMVITWSTVDATNSSIVEYGDENIGQFQELGTSIRFQSQGEMNLTQYIHHVTLRNLKPGQIYLYHCGSYLGWSELYYFRAMRDDEAWAPQLAVYGDLGNVNAQTLSRLQRETQLQYYDAILHVGDFAYNLDWENGMIGDSFMEQIQPIAAYVPYMTCPGNHEYLDNFFQYKKRFNMPGKSENMYYSFNMGPVHFISISTECYYFLEYGLEPAVLQYEWLVKDLKEANLPENRAKRPWIITYGHRPMYCSNFDGGDCARKFCRVRNGLPETGWFGLEDLFMEYGVDLTFWAHEHSYERIWPIYNLTVYNGSYEEPYRNPKALVHVITGSAGCDEIHDPFIPNKPNWSAFRSIDYGYTRLKIFNKTHLYIEQLSEDLHGQIIDSFYLIRDKHESYGIPPV